MSKRNHSVVAISSDSDEDKTADIQFKKEIEASRLQRQRTTRSTRTIKNLKEESDVDGSEEEIKISKKRKIESDDDTNFEVSAIKKSAPKVKKISKVEKVVKPKVTRTKKVTKTVKREASGYDSDNTIEITNGESGTGKVEKPKVTRTKRITKAIKKEANDKNIVGTSTEVMKQDVSDFESKHPWTEAELLADLENIDINVARNITRLFQQENTLPFISRYRKELTNGMPVEKLRDVRECYDNILTIQAKAKSILKTIEKQGQFSNEIKNSILAARSLDELEHLYAPFKPASKRSLAERARKLGLEPPAEAILNGIGTVDLTKYIDEKTEGLASMVDVLHGIQHIIADVISKDTAILDKLRELYKSQNMCIESSLSKTAKGESKTGKSSVGSKIKDIKNKNVDPEKYKLYFNFKCPLKYIKPHQVLAINRGENQKILSIKISIPESVNNNFLRFCQIKWLRGGCQYATRTKLITDALNDAYKRLLNPLIVRQIRTELNKIAERAAVEVFSNNLKYLLLTQPVKGSKVLGIDPGFAKGCKMALISERGTVLETLILYLHTGQNRKDQDMYRFTNIMHKHSCTLIALGNGTACRETEQFLGYLIESGRLLSGTRYSIVNERGASIYSCSDEARKEFPDMDPNLISAVFLARCLQDPLCEFVKVEPKHLGVGMYQHDVSEKLLTTALKEVVVECVSFVGVDINTASNVLLRQVAGMNAARAEKIINYRMKFGSFSSRERVRDVPGIGPKTYEQCAGFIRVIPETAGEEVNPLDATWVHPESYDIAEKIISLSKLNLSNLGTDDFMKEIHNFALALDKTAFAEQNKVPLARVCIVLEALRRNPNEDFRCDNKLNRPLFKKGITQISDLKTGTILTGVVSNVTHFGSFVDIGLGHDGLIPKSTLGSRELFLGNHVEVKVLSVEIQRKRVTLYLEKVLV